MRALFAAGLTALLWGLWSYAEMAAARLQGPYAAGLLMSLAGLGVYALEIPLLLLLLRAEGTRVRADSAAILWSVLAMVCLSVAALPYLYACRHGRPVMVLAVSSAYPVVTLLLTAAVTREVPTALQVLGLVLVIGGVVLVGSEP